MKHLEYFPVEVNQADYKTLLRVPGIGYKSASRIVKARRLGTLTYEDLKKMGVVLKRAVYFITCEGKMMYPVKFTEESIARNLGIWGTASERGGSYGISAIVTVR